MMVVLNGRLVPDEHALVSVFDRGFLYGDGLFETILVRRGVPFRWSQHLARLDRGAKRLRIPIPFPPGRLREFADQLIGKNHLPESILRLALSRGVGPRGYSTQGADSPTLVMTLHPIPAFRGSAGLTAGVADTGPDPSHEGGHSPVPVARPTLQWRLITSSVRVAAHDPLAALKTASKLPQILARLEAEEQGADEALLLNTNGQVAEAASGNLFWFEGETVCTPPLDAGLLAGVTRSVVLELCQSLEWTSKEKNIRPALLKRMNGVFLTLSTLGIVEAVSLDGEPLPRSKRIAHLRRAYGHLVAAECGMQS